MSASSFVVPISDLVSEPGARRPVDLDVSVDWAVGPTTVGPGVEAWLVLENASGTIVVRGTVSTRLVLGCHRCLREWTEDLDVSVTEALGLEGDDGYGIDADGADLEPVLRDAVLLEVPMRPLCHPDCLGLCSTCGADLNTGACPGHDDEAASPFAVLRDLLEP